MTTAIGAYATASALKTRIAISDTTDDTTLSNVCDQVNQYVETKTGRVLAPIASAVILLDGDGSRVLRYPRDPGRVAARMRRVHGAAFYGRGVAVLPAPRPRRPPSRLAVHPLEFTDIATGTFTSFPRGFDTVRMTATTGGRRSPTTSRSSRWSPRPAPGMPSSRASRTSWGPMTWAGRSSRGSSRRAIRDPARLRRGPARMTTRPSTSRPSAPLSRPFRGSHHRHAHGRRRDARPTPSRPRTSATPAHLRRSATARWSPARASGARDEHRRPAAARQAPRRSRARRGAAAALAAYLLHASVDQLKLGLGQRAGTASTRRSRPAGGPSTRSEPWSSTRSASTGGLYQRDREPDP